MKSAIWEEGDHLYMVSPVSLVSPGENEIEEFAFAEQLKSAAPNENLMWLRGQYVEADRPNLNGQMWQEGELAIKSLTPMFMPVTVMHDPRTAVGLIADIALLTPDANKVPRARLDSTLAVWRHRFPEVAEEAEENYKSGTLMQSMEALSPYYSCSDCGQAFHKLPDGAERAKWCAHLKGEEGSAAARILQNVTFTGTGLIFGTRGARGAYSEAHLDVDQAEIAEFHREAHDRTKHDRKTSPRRRDRKVKNVETVEISKSEYDRLQADARKVGELESRATAAEEAKQEAERKVEAVETEKVEAERKLKDAETALDEAKEEGRKAELASDRLGSLGKGFTSKLGEFTSARLTEQAKTLSDEEWDNRLKELEELSGEQRDAKLDGDDGEGEESGTGKSGGKDGEFSREEVARANLGGKKSGGDSNGDVSPEQRRSVVGSLVPKA
jgi:hypothetical protein